MTATPLIVKLKKEFIKQFCSNCLVQGPKFECPKCGFLTYCSQECLESHNHRFECSSALGSVPERIRFVSIAMALKDRSSIHQMTSQAASLVKVTKVAEFVLTSLYVYICLPNLEINEKSFIEIVHVMGTLRVNAFSISHKEDAIATGLYCPSNLINH